MTSPDGITWTARTAAGDNDTWQSVTYGNGLFVALGWEADDNIITSPDGITWIAKTINSGQWFSIAHGNNSFVAVGSSVETASSTSLTIPALTVASLTNDSATTFTNSATTTVTSAFINNGYFSAEDSLMAMEGDYTNNGTFNASTSEVTFSGTAQQTATGTMTGLQ